MFKGNWGLLVLIFVVTTAHAEQADRWQKVFAEARQRCKVETKNEPKTYSEDYKWGEPLVEMKLRYEEFYKSGKRLPARAYYDEKSNEFVMPVYSNQPDKLVRVPERLIKSIIRHIEVALEREYAQFVFHADMGHTHFFIPDGYYYKEVASLDNVLAMEKIYNYPETLILYHTAEQLKMVDDNNELLKDTFIQWRYYTRNIVGDNKGLGRIQILKDFSKRFNTVGELEGHRFYAGPYISASKDGCFQVHVKDQVFYFDLNTQGPPTKYPDRVY